MPAYPEYPGHLAYIEGDKAKAAFSFLVERSQGLPGYTARPRQHGYIERNLHYLDERGRSLFAFNIAKYWLLFYLMRPSETHTEAALAEIRKAFPDATRTKSDELTFRIHDVAEAELAMRLVFGVVNQVDGYCFPEEVSSEVHFEGAVSTITVNSYERNAHARTACVRYYGYRCVVCSFDFAERYGQLGEGFIHVHHLVELSSIGTEYTVDPIRDLRPVCPNCHAMLHRRSPPLTLDELQQNLTPLKPSPKDGLPS